MQIQASKVAVGAIVGAGVAAAAALGLSGSLDQELIQQGAEAAVKKIAESPDMVQHGIAFVAQPTLTEQFGNYVAERAGELGQALNVYSPHEIVINTLQGPVEIANITQLQSLLESHTLTPEAENQLRQIVAGFLAHASQGVAGAETILPNSPLVELSQKIHDLDSLWAGNKPYLNGLATIHPENIDGLVKVPLTNGWDSYIDPEKFTTHFGTLTQGATPAQLTAFNELNSLLNPSMGTTIPAAGAGALGGGLLGAMASGKPENNRRFTDRVQPKAAAAITAKKPEQQAWVQTVQAGAEQTPPQVTR